jgi:hypothetical protein
VLVDHGLHCIDPASVENKENFPVAFEGARLLDIMSVVGVENLCLHKRRDVTWVPEALGDEVK